MTEEESTVAGQEPKELFETSSEDKNNNILIVYF